MLVKELIMILGPPVSGKGTQARLLAEKLKAPFLSAGDLLRSGTRDGILGKNVKAIMDAGKLVPEKYLLTVVDRRLAEITNKLIIADGLNRSEEQRPSVERIFKKHNIRIKFVFNLQISEKEILDRLANRMICEDCNWMCNLKTAPPKVNGKCDKCGGDLHRRSDEKSIKKRLSEFNKHTEPVLNHYREQGIVVDINANNSIQAIHKEILSKLKSF